MKRYFGTLREAKKAMKIKDPNGIHIRVWDMGKHRKKRRFFVGTHIEWLNFAK